MNAAWMDAENEHDRARDIYRATHPRPTMRERREARVWPAAFVTITIAACTLAAAIEGGAL